MFKNKIFIIGVILAATVGWFVYNRMEKKETSAEVYLEIQPTVGVLQTFISTTGTVLPKNRLEVKPPVNGRIESILVKEGENVKAGQTIAWMSSTERAALLDAARGKGEEALKYFEDVYKPIPLLSPIDGEVIVATTQPAQTVTTADAVIVLSDHLIVRAQVDETDIGKIFLQQEATISLDAYPDTKIKSQVEHVYYESQTVNNVTIYQVDLRPEAVPLFFRSGMNTTVDFKEKSKENVLLLPVDAVKKEKEESYVFLKDPMSQEPLRRPVVIGITDDKNIEILSGVTTQDTVLVKSKKFVLPKGDARVNPFMPARRRR